MVVNRWTVASCALALSVNSALAQPAAPLTQDGQQPIGPIELKRNAPPLHVPAIAPEGMRPATPNPADESPPPVRSISERNPRLSPAERQSVRIANSYNKDRSMPSTGAGGRVLYTFGETMPTLVCAPLFVCAVELEEGEVVNGIDVGDPRFQPAPAMEGSGKEARSLVVVKPTDAGLVSNLMIHTDRRSYTIKLMSRRTDWVSRVAFVYPPSRDAQWADYRERTEAQRKDLEAKRERAPVLPGLGVNVDALDFRYEVTGDRPPWTPVRVYNDGARTYVQMPPAMASGEAPVIVSIAESDGSKELVNYRLRGDTFVVDRVIQRAALISGVGRSQTRVNIAHAGSEEASQNNAGPRGEYP